MKGLTTLDLPTLNPSFIVFPTLVYDENNVILIDSGYPGTYEELQEALKAKGFKLSDITHIIITHHDIDHIGNLNAILNDYPNIRVLASYIEEPYLTGGKPPIKLSKGDFKENINRMVENIPSPKKEKVKYALEHLPIERVTVIHDKELLPFCGGIQVIYTPGHTPGHICLYLERYKTLVSGDELNVIDGKLQGPKPQFTQDMAQALNSLTKLRKYDISSIFCYHGGVYQDDPNSSIVNIATKDN